MRKKGKSGANSHFADCGGGRDGDEMGMEEQEEEKWGCGKFAKWENCGAKWQNADLRAEWSP